MRYFSFVVRIEQWIRIRCKVISGIRIRIKVMGIRIRLVTQTRMQIRIQVSKIMRINADPGPTAWKLFLGTVHKLLKTIYWKIYKITTLAGSGSALKSRIRIRIMWKVGSESTSIKNLNPDPHQIKIRIRIRIKMIRSYRTMYTFYVSFSFTCLVFYLFWSVTEPDLDSAVQSVWLRIPDPEGAESLDLFQKCFFSCF